MFNILIIFKKELRSYFNSPIAYIFLVIFLVVSNWLFFSRFFLVGEVSMRSFFGVLPWLFLILLPALSMRLWSEEKRSGSLELLLTLPIRDFEAVLGKFLGALSFLIISLVLSLPTAITVISLGNADSGEIIGGYLASLLFGVAVLSFGSFMSSITRNQIVAFLLTAVFTFVFIIMGQDYVLAPLSGFLAQILNFLSLSSHFNVISRGLIDLGDAAYFVGFAFFWLFLNVKVLQARYYKG
ncbi:MAG: ABC transporter permease [Patescibacteria group bacterium]